MAKRQKPKRIKLKKEKVEKIQKNYSCPTFLPKIILKCCCGHEVYNCRYQLTGICLPKKTEFNY